MDKKGRNSKQYASFRFFCHPVRVGGKEGDRINDHHLSLAEKKTTQENSIT